ncbi:MAG: methyltransferase domain-containing protein [Richelia sp. RM1_1_1]|nr:methyltransferase domain-containing protein [Richelia sp. RM1_1_1]
MINKKRSDSFNEVAEIYDIARPGYPSELIEDVIKFANLLPWATILDIGTGTGKGTLPFAEKGYTIHCVEPGEKLVAIARDNLRFYPKVTFDIKTFEDCDLRADTFDLVISAQAFHWINREIGYFKVAQVLKENGYIALFWNFSPTLDTPVFKALNQAFQKYLPSMVYNPPSISSLIEKRKKWIVDSKYFKDLIIKEYSWNIDYDTNQYLNLLKTQTTYQTFSEDEKQSLSNVVIEILNAYGGYVTKSYLSVLFLAQKI